MGVQDRLRTVRERIDEAAARSGRAPNAVQLVGVCKGVAPELVAEAIEAGLEDVGENRVQDAAANKPLISSASTRESRWHMVGHLQTNKAKLALRVFDTIQSVDSVRIAQALSRLAERIVPVFLEVQFAHAPDRFGFQPDAIADVLDEVRALPKIDVAGLMTVAPLGLDEDATRQVFRALRERRDEVVEARPDLPRLDLSMGMTNDYSVAIEEGATVVRIGRAIFAV